MASIGSPLGGLGARIAGSTGRIVGGLGALAGSLHLTEWTLSTEAVWPAALQAGDVSTAGAELAEYTASHPAYAALVLVGVAALVFAE